MKKTVKTKMNKIISAVTAAALAVTLCPASALASAGDVPLGRSSLDAQNSVSRAGETSTHINVTAPLKVVFEKAGQEQVSYDVSKPEGWNTASTYPTATVSFTNSNTLKDVYLSDVQVIQDNNANVGNLFKNDTLGTTENPALTLLNGPAATANATAKIDTISKSMGTSGHMTFVDNTDKDNVKKRFKVRKNGSANNFTLVLNPNGGTLKDEADLLNDSRLQGNTTEFARLVWTFAVSDGLSGSGVGNLTDDKGMYLKILDNPASLSAEENSAGSSKLSQEQLDMLDSCKGEIFTVEEIKEHSKELGLDPNDTDSDLYHLYSALTDSLMPEGDYECMVEYKGAYDGGDYTISNFGTTAWPVRIVGLNQDTPTDTATYGASRVGLTFQFLDCISRSMLYNSTSNAGGWAGTNASTLRAKLRTGGTYFNNLTINGSLVTVDKKSDAGSKNTTTVNTTQEQLFIPSYRELVGNNSPAFTQSCIVNSGTGADFTEQYRFYQNKGIIGNNVNYKWLVKGVGPYWVSNASNSWNTMPTYNQGLDKSTSAVTSLSDGNTSTCGTHWWERSTNPTQTGYFPSVGNFGDPDYNTYPNNVYGVAPCFCL